MSFLKSLSKLWSVSSSVPVNCECTAPLLPEVRQRLCRTKGRRTESEKARGSCGQSLGETYFKILCDLQQI